MCIAQCLYFTASTDVGAAPQPDTHSFSHSSSRSVYLAVLDKTLPFRLSCGAAKSLSASARQAVHCQGGVFAITIPDNGEDLSQSSQAPQKPELSFPCGLFILR
jgi:hypothetical protein